MSLCTSTAKQTRRRGFQGPVRRGLGRAGGVWAGVMHSRMWVQLGDPRTHAEGPGQGNDASSSHAAAPEKEKTALESLAVTSSLRWRMPPAQMTKRWRSPSVRESHQTFWTPSTSRTGLASSRVRRCQYDVRRVRERARSRSRV